MTSSWQAEYYRSESLGEDDLSLVRVHPIFHPAVVSYAEVGLGDAVIEANPVFSHVAMNGVIVSVKMANADWSSLNKHWLFLGTNFLKIENKMPKRT